MIFDYMVFVSCNNNYIFNLSLNTMANILSIKRWPRMGSNNLGVPLETGDSLEPKPAAIITNFN